MTPLTWTQSQAAKRLRASQIAAQLGVSLRTVQSLAARGEIPAYRVGKSWTFDPDEIKLWQRAEREAREATCSRNAGASGTSGTQARTSESAKKAYTQAISALLKSGRPRSATA